MTIRLLVIIALISLNSCMSTSPMFDSYIDYNYPHLNKFKVNKSNRLKGVKLAFEEYLKNFDGVDSSLIVIVNDWSYASIKYFSSDVHFIKDYKLDKSFRFNQRDVRPINIDTLIINQFKTNGTSNINYIANYVRENGIENIVTILDTENCDLFGHIGGTVITVFDANKNIVGSHFFSSKLFCVDSEFQRNMVEKFLERNHVQKN